MRLSLKKGAHAVLSGGRVQEIRGFREMWDTTAPDPGVFRRPQHRYLHR
jgi:hypothetical protein